MQNWMQALAGHYESMRAAHPDADLLILFDIDGTILDVRHMLLYLLQAYDQHHGTALFRHRHVSEITCTPEQLEQGLISLGIDTAHHQPVLEWCRNYRWSMAAVLESHRPFPGVLEVIRWFQLQPRTHVGLNSSRPECLREETLCSLNRLGREYRVHFDSDLLFMRELEADCDLAAKVAGVRYFQDSGYRVFAMVDNRPDNLEAVAAADPENEILLLHAGTMFQQRPARIPAKAIQGNVYDLTQLIPKRSFPRHIQFAWSGVNHEASLLRFLASNVHWADLSLLTNPWETAALEDADSDVQATSDLFREFATRLHARRRGIRVELKTDQVLNQRLYDSLRMAQIPAENIWFHADVEQLSEAGFRYLAETHPGAVIEVSIDFLVPLILNGTPLAESVLDRLSDWGVNRFSLSWSAPRIRAVHETLEHWGFEITIYGVRNLEIFLQAVLLSPVAICSDFDFPEWRQPVTGKRRVHSITGEELKLA